MQNYRGTGTAVELGVLERRRAKCSTIPVPDRNYRVPVPYRRYGTGMFVHRDIPDFDGNRAQKMKYHNTITICFTICLFISPDLDGHRHFSLRRSNESIFKEKMKNQKIAFQEAEVFESKITVNGLIKRLI